jgi:hypothetical protein
MAQADSKKKKGKPLSDLTPPEFEHYQRVSAALELYSGILVRTKEMVVETFDMKVAVLHDGERRQIIDIARDIYNTTVTDQVLRDIAASLPATVIETVLASDETPRDVQAGETQTTPGVPVAGF